jgi:hypothetical protein
VLSSAVGEPEVSAQARWKGSEGLSCGLPAKPNEARGDGTMENEIGGSADQPTLRDAGPGLEQAVRELCRLFLDLEVERDALASAIKEADLLDIEISASDSMCAFQGVQRALQVVEHLVAAARAAEQRGREALRKHHRQLDELFQRAMEQTPGKITHDLLAKLRAELGPVDGEPAHENGDAQPTSIGPSAEIVRAT